jgi:protein gp37
MVENSKIEWTTHTFNPWVGCTKISAACDHCYAEGWAKRTGGAALWQGERRRTTPQNWRKPLKWNAAAYASGVRPRVFCASLADVFDNQVPQQWRSDLWHLIAETPWLDWLLLTKRPQLIAGMPPDRIWSGWDHVWLGTTVENATEANRRIPYLRATPARTRFLSCEPLLEAIAPDLDGIDWLICGGESGGGARDMDPAWACGLRDQCAANGTAFFMKQMARKAPIPDDLLVRQFPRPTLAFAAVA